MIDRMGKIHAIEFVILNFVAEDRIDHIHIHHNYKHRFESFVRVYLYVV